jgi:hypothetical protein
VFKVEERLMTNNKTQYIFDGRTLLNHPYRVILTDTVLTHNSYGRPRPVAGTWHLIDGWMDQWMS